MSTACPNCSRPTRQGAQFCGYCGIDLDAPLKNSLAHGLAESSGNPSDPGLAAPPNTRRRDPARVASFIAIVILVIIVALAVLFRFWGFI
jgi:hypothetical protein